MAIPTALLAPVVLLVQLAKSEWVNVEDWFLTDVEIAAESCGRSRSHTAGDFPGLAPFTGGNAVEFIPDGSTFFERLKQDVDSTMGGDKIYGSGWTFTPDLELVVDPQTHEFGRLYDCLSDGTLSAACDLLGVAADECEISLVGAAYPIMTGTDAEHECCAETSTGVGDCTSAAGVFSRANSRGVDIKLLVWNNMLPGTNGGAYLEYGQEKLNKLFQERSGSKSVYVLDGRTHDESKTASSTAVPRSIHTKHFSFVDGQGKATVSYAGGIDVGTCRYDVSDAQRRLRGGGTRSVQETCSGWLDQSVRIQGPAAADIANAFVQRWNWKEDLNHPQAKGNANEFDSRFAEVDPSVGVATGAPAGDQYVQVLRTFGCDAGQPFTQCGEYTILAALLKAIQKAERFVFVEDQYGFDVAPIRSALSDALDRGVNVIAVVNGVGAEMGSTFCGDNVENMWSSLRQKGAYVFQYNMEDYGDYVHSKTWVVDDCWFMTGSANLNWRSMTADPELSVAVMESTCPGSWVKRVRCELWAELTTSGATADSICREPADSPGDVAGIVLSIFGASGEQTGKLFPMVLGSDGDGAWGLIEEWMQFVCDYTDPDARCKPYDDSDKTCSYEDAFDSSYCDAGASGDYPLTVSTSDGWWWEGTGTDVYVDIRLWGSSGSSGWVSLHTLDHGSWNLFERGDDDEFSIQTCNAGELTGFELDVYGFNHPVYGIAGQWKLESVTVPGCGILNYNNWIRADTHNSLTKVSYECPAKEWSQWSSWSAPQYTCPVPGAAPGKSSKTRSRSCTQGGLSCGDESDTMTEEVACQEVTTYGACSKNCGGGTRVLLHTCNLGGLTCYVAQPTTQACNTQACATWNSPDTWNSRRRRTCPSGYTLTGTDSRRRRRRWYGSSTIYQCSQEADPF